MEDAGKRLARLKRRLGFDGDEKDGLLTDLLEDAELFVLDYTGRDFLPRGLDAALTELAAAGYNRRGLEGASAHAEGGVSVTLEGLPARVKAQLDRHRVGKVM